MVDLLQRLGLSGFFGLLIGFAVVTWVAPKTTGGYALTIFICVGFSTAVASIYRGVVNSRNRAAGLEKSAGAEEKPKLNRRQAKPREK